MKGKYKIIYIYQSGNLKFMNLNNILISRLKPFCIGSFDPLLSIDRAKYLREQLLDFFINNQSKFNISINQKFKLDNQIDTEKFQILLDSLSDENKLFIEKLLSHDFKDALLKKLWLRLLVNRFDKYLIDILLNKFFNYDSFKPSIEFSFMPIGSKIVPHTDSVGKIFSGLIYLPLPEANDIDQGINFYDYDLDNYDNTHLESLEEQSQFEDKSKLIFKPEFDNRFHFFLRNSRSWHSVSQVTNPDRDYIRVSINYNILIHDSLLGRIRRILGF